MHKVIDCAWNVGSYAAELQSAGVETVIRYYNRQNSSRLPSKRLSKKEAEDLSKAGISLAVVYQQRGGANGNISDLDAGSGRSDADRALALAKEIGQPKGSAIYFAIDYDYYLESQMKAIEPYFREVAAKLKGKYKVGLYGSGRQGQYMLDKGHIDLVWLAGAKGWSGTRAMLRTDRWALFQQDLELNWPGGLFAYDGNIVNPAWSDFGQFHVADAFVDVPPQRTTFVLSEVVARSGLRLRRGPGTDYSIETVLPSGAYVNELAIEGEWVQVDVGGDGLADGYVYGKFLKTVSGGWPVVPDDPVPSPYSIARAELALDIRERPGLANNPRIVMYHESTQPWSGTGDHVAWCSSFVNHCVEQAGLVGTDSQSARSWSDWGEEVNREDAREGDICVFKRGSNPAHGHVAFFVADKGERIAVLGGNQSDSVRISNYKASDLITIRRS